MRVRLTVVATLVFAITISAAAFGLVRLVRTNFVDRIEETNQQQLDDAAGDSSSNGDLQPPPDHHVYCCIPGPDGQLHYYTHRLPSRGSKPPSVRVRTTAGNITLVAQQSTEEVDRTVDSVSTVLLFAVPAMIALVALAAWYFAGRSAPAGRGDPSPGRVDHRRRPCTGVCPNPTPTTRWAAWRAR